MTTEADESIFSLESIDPDMVVENKKTTTLESKQVFEKERLENDSVSTFQSKQAPPAEIATGQSKKAKTTDEGSTTSSTSSLSRTAKHSINTKMTNIDTRMNNIENKVKGVEARLASKVDLILQQLQIQSKQIVTPTKTSNEGIAAQLENPGDLTQSPGQS